MKKRIFLSVLSVSFLVSTLPMNILASEMDKKIISIESKEEDSIYYETDSDNTLQEVPYTYGDVNMDGNIDDKDNALTLKYISGILENGVLFNEKAANINMDSYVDLIDIILNFDNYTE